MLQFMITMTIKHSDGDREINISANTMKELVDDKLPDWLPKLKDDIRMLKMTKRFKRNPKREEALERKSGWYYDA